MIAAPKTTVFSLLAASGMVVLAYLIIGQGNTVYLNAEPVVLPLAKQPSHRSSALQPVLKQGLQPVFQVNQGQFDSRIRYAATGHGYQAYLTQDQLSIVRANDEQRQVTGIRFLNSNPTAQLSASEQGSEVHHYYTAGKTVENVPTYGRVAYQSLYEGIDAILYSRQGQMEYDFKLQPGADPKQISLEFTGVKQARIATNGDLLLTTDLGVFRQQAPVSYQRLADKRIVVKSRYILSKIEDGFLVSFALGDYRTDLPLVIDPVLDYGTYVGGIGNDSGNDIVTDSAGNVYITGETASASDFPFLPSKVTVNKDVFVAKFIPDNKQFPADSQRVYVTHIGGTGNDIAHALDIDANDNVFIVGETNSTDLIPASPAALQTNAYQANNKGLTDGFIARLDAAGTVIYMTYFGGSDDDIIHGVAVDAQANVYITGETNTDNAAATPAFPIKAAFAFETAGTDGQTGTFHQYDGSVYEGGMSVAFVAKIDVTAIGINGLVYSSYLGGNGPSCIPPTGVAQNNCTPLNNTNTEREAGLDIAIDSVGRAYVTGVTTSNLFFPMTKGAYQTFCGSQTGTDNAGNPSGSCDFVSPNEYSDAFLSVVDSFNPNNLHISMRYSTFLGGSGTDIAYGIDVDDSANGTLLSQVYLTGSTRSFKDANNLGGFPFTQNANPSQVSAPNAATALEDTFISVINPNNTGVAGLIFSSYLGNAAASDIGRDIVVENGTGNLYIGGETNGSSSIGIIQGYNLPTFVLGVPSNPTAPTSTTGIDGFIARIDITKVTGNTVPFFSLIGGGGGAATFNNTTTDRVNAVAVDATGNIYLTGSTESEYEYNSTQNQGSGFMITRGFDSDGSVSGIVGTALLAFQTKCGDPAVVAATQQTHNCNKAAAANTTDAFIIKLNTEADLSVVLTTPVGTDSVNVDAVQPYKFTVTNNGPETARSVTLTAMVTPTPDAANLNAGVAYNFISNVLTINGIKKGCEQPLGSGGDINCFAPNIPNGGQVEIIMNGSVGGNFNAAAIGDVVGTILVDASVATASTDPKNSNNTVNQQNNITIGTLFDARIDMVPNKTQAIGGENITYTITVTNDGPGNSGGLKVNIPLTPDNQIGFDINNVGGFTMPTNALAGSCNKAPQGVGIDCAVAGLQAGESATWNLIIQALPSSAAPEYTIGGATVTETSGSKSDKDATNNATSYTDPQTQQQFINRPVNVLAGADLVLDVNTRPLGNNRFSYDMTLRNLGPAQAENISLRAVLPSGLDNPSPQALGANCSAAPHGSVLAPSGIAFVDCTFADVRGGPMASGDSFSWSVAVDGVAGSSGLTPLTFSFTSTTADPDNTNNIITRSVNLGGGGFSSNRGGGALDILALALLVVFVFFARMRMMAFSMPCRLKTH